MKVVIETEDFATAEQLLDYLARMQRESDEYAAESPEDYSAGYGPLSLGTEHMELAARVVGLLHPRNAPHHETRYAIQPLRGKIE